ncbi:hypothetical protein BGX33_004936 [Mortierella sp. NVP41]|nr:hypothetical protein BGX33_004936 [Mortierella sp. NVP41]
MSRSKALKSKALIEAQLAVKLDNDGYIPEALEAYGKAVVLLDQVMKSGYSFEENERLQAIANAGNMGHRLSIADVFYKKFGCNVFMLSYRGYGLSEGSPTEKGLRMDAQTALDFIKKHPVIAETKLIAYGQSIGGAVSIDIVARNEDKFSGLIIENTFLSLPKVIPHVLPMISRVVFLCHQVWDSENMIQQITRLPVLFLSGRKDELVPPAHMRKLYRLLDTTGESVWREFPEGTHNDTCLKPGYFEAIKSFLEGIMDRTKA